MNTSGIGKRIIDLREERNWSQTKLAKRLNINKSVMNRIESEERPLRDYELDTIASVLETSTDYILGRDLNEEKEVYHAQNTSFLNEVVEALGINDLSFKDINNLSQIKEEDRQEIVNHIKYIIQRAASKRKN